MRNPACAALGLCESRLFVMDTRIRSHWLHTVNGCVIQCGFDKFPVCQVATTIVMRYVA